MPTTAKGSVAQAGHEFIRRHFGEDAWRVALESLTQDEWKTVTSVGRSTQYPIHIDAKIFEAIHTQCCNGDLHRFERELREMGAAQADDMLNGVFSIFARFVSPQQAFSRAGSIVAAAYDGVTSETRPAENGRGGQLILRGLGELKYGAASISGWIERALERFGAKSPRVVERNWQAGSLASNELVFELSWQES